MFVSNKSLRFLLDSLVCVMHVEEMNILDHHSQNAGVYKNTSNLRWKYRRKKSVFPTEKWTSDGNCDGKCIVGNQLVAKKNPTESNGNSDGISSSKTRRTACVCKPKTTGISDEISDGNSRQKIRRKLLPFLGKSF